MSADYYYMQLRDIISHYQEQKSLSIFEGEIEIDESYFDGTCKEKDVAEYLEK